MLNAWTIKIIRYIHLQIYTHEYTILNRIDDMRISGTEPWSVILSQTK